ncbi:hypothetical protein COOONC_21664 [Cooperia oncophora]
MKQHPVSDEEMVVAAVENDENYRLTHEDVRVSTEKDPLLREIKSYVKHGRWPEVEPKLAPFFNRKETLPLICEKSIKVPLESWPTPTRAWQRIHVDFAGPICSCYYMVIVDAYSKWPGGYRNEKHFGKSDCKGAEKDIREIWTTTDYCQ